MGNFTPISRRPAKCAMRTACAHSGALRAPLIQGDVMEHFAGWREIFQKSSLSRPQKHTTHAPDYSFISSVLRESRGARRRHGNKSPPQSGATFYSSLLRIQPEISFPKNCHQTLFCLFWKPEFKENGLWIIADYRSCSQVFRRLSQFSA